MSEPVSGGIRSRSCGCREGAAAAGLALALFLLILAFGFEPRFPIGLGSVDSDLGHGAAWVLGAALCGKVLGRVRSASREKYG